MTFDSLWRLFRIHPAVCVDPDGRVRTEPGPAAVLPGSFHPLHHGHRALAQATAARLGVAVEFELSIVNVDKPDLSEADVERRVSQFRAVGPVWITRAATFEQKAALFPGSAFVLGWDTAIRVIDAKYYSGESGRDAALQKMRDLRCRLVVAGRIDASGVFRTWDPALAGEFADLFVPLSEAEVRADVSSTRLRRG